MDKTHLMNLYLSLQEFTKNALRENKELKELLEIRRKLDFAASSEKQDYGMQMLFDELDVQRQIPDELKSQASVEVKPHTRKKPHKLASLPADTPIVEIHHEDTAVCSCGNCGGQEMVRIEDKVIDRIGHQPAKRYIERNIYAQYRCSLCEAEKEDGESNIAVAGFTPSVDSLIAAPSLAAHAAVQKFADGLPLYRQSGIFRREGIEFSRQTLSNWLLAYWDLLQPLGKRLKEVILESYLINQDETPIQVLHPGQNADTKNHFMVVQVGSSGSHEKVVLFTYVANRRIDTIDGLLAGYRNYVQTDGLKGYNHLKNHIGCWVHAVRRFKQILKTNPKAENARKICKYAAKLYKIEEQERKHVLDNLITEEEFLVSRRIQAKSVIADIKEFADSIREKYTKGSAMGKALNYLYEYWPTLTNYVDCYEASPSNNSAENAIRPFVCGRKYVLNQFMCC